MSNEEPKVKMVDFFDVKIRVIKNMETNETSVLVEGPTFKRVIEALTYMIDNEHTSHE